MILTFNAETIEIGAISGGVGGAGGSGDIGGIGGLGEGPILNIAPDVRWKSVSGGIGGDGGTGIELGGNGGMGKAPLITIARKPPHVSINPADSINAHQSDEFDITSLKLDEYTGDVTVTKSTGVFQSEPSSEYQASPADLPAPLVYALQLPSFLGAFVKGWSSRTILQNTTFVGRGWTGWWLPIGVGVSVFVVVGERLRFGRGIWIFSRRDP
ncbi:hypothetical protein B0H19DRAFT_577377 [Mycena capillaripes]|nr:hypothetical protein B0H19DRAFT_577377 [Mycena capillaripes]